MKMEPDSITIGEGTLRVCVCKPGHIAALGQGPDLRRTTDLFVPVWPGPGQPICSGLAPQGIGPSGDNLEFPAHTCVPFRSRTGSG